MTTPTLEDVVAELERLRRRVVELERASGLYATNKELDAPDGDPVVRFAPNAWRGPVMVGKHYSECHPGFLDLLATALARMAERPKPGKEKYAASNRDQARLARSWARRVRARGEQGEPEPEAAPKPAGRPRRARRGAVTEGRPPAGAAPSPTQDDAEDDWLATPSARNAGGPP